MKAIESGQDWKIAALRSSFHVHFFFYIIVKTIFLFYCDFINVHYNVVICMRILSICLNTLKGKGSVIKISIGKIYG